MVKLTESIREPSPRAKGRRLGRAARRGVRSEPRRTRGKKAARHARGGARVASVNFAIAFASQIKGNRGSLIILIVMAIRVPWQPMAQKFQNSEIP